MLFLNSYIISNREKRELVDYYYEKIIKISRNQDFYRKLMVPDTIDGRFDLLALFSIILTFFLSKLEGNGKVISQILFDKIFLDLDLSLREMGAGDTGVHLKIKKMVNSYMGRQKVYCKCIDDHDFIKLKLHIIKNIYRNIDDYGLAPDHLTNYCKSCVLFFENKPNKFLLSKEVDFPIYV